MIDEGRIAKLSADTVSIIGQTVLLWLTLLAGERRKATLGHVDNNYASWSELDASPLAQQFTPASNTTSSQNYLLGSLDDNTSNEMPLMDDSWLLGLPAATQASCLDLVSSLPSPYKNYLSIQKLSFYAARIQNALYIGLPLFLAQKEDDISPWYWHTQFAALVSQNLNSDATCTLEPSASPYEFQVQRPVRRKPCFSLSESVMPDLYPTALQRSRPHGMYLDMIPFPIFRDRVITLLSMDPPAFEECELKRDIESDGLRVWGVGQGSTTRTASLVRDRRNWECTRWFYKKWKLLVDGSGLDEQSQWWRTMRGEEESDADN